MPQLSLLWEENLLLMTKSYPEERIHVQEYSGSECPQTRPILKSLLVGLNAGLFQVSHQSAHRLPSFCPRRLHLTKNIFPHETSWPRHISIFMSLR